MPSRRSGRSESTPIAVASPWTGKQILIIGDSLSDGTSAKPGTYGAPPQPPRTPGQFLATALEQAGAKRVRVQARGGRAAAHWIKHRDCVKKDTQGDCTEFYPKRGLEIIADEIRDHRPDIAIIILGTNDLSYDVQTNRTAFTQLKTPFDLAGIPVFHIGPPAFDPTQRAKEYKLAGNVVAVGRELFGKRFLDAQPMTQDILTPEQGRAGDFVHFKLAGAKLWATRMADTLTHAVTETPAVASTPGPLPTTSTGTGAVRAPGRSFLFGFLTIGGVTALGLLGFVLVRRMTVPAQPVAGLDRGRDR
jgi:lysophospholipase L1-like esterase